MTFAYVVRTPATLEVGDAVLAYVSADGHGRNFASLTAGLTTSANLPTVGQITSVNVDTSTSWTTQAELTTLDYTGTGAGELDVESTTGDAALPGEGPIHVNLVNAATDLVNAPSHMAPWFDQSTVIVCATG
jgi:hypothetical protein